MAVQLVGTIHFYVGLASDKKPTSGVRAGSLFNERDTGNVYRLNHTGAWEKDSSFALSAGDFRSGIGELKRLLEPMLLEIQMANRAEGIKAA